MPDTADIEYLRRSAEQNLNIGGAPDIDDTRERTILHVLKEREILLRFFQDVSGRVMTPQELTEAINSVDQEYCKLVESEHSKTEQYFDFP